MAPWYVASIRAGDYAFSNLQKRTACFNLFIKEVDKIIDAKYFSGARTPVTRAQFEKVKPRLLNILSMTTKVFPIFATTSVSILERCKNLLNIGQLKFQILRNISECLRETLSMEDKYIRLQTKITTHFDAPTFEFAREARLSAPSLP